MDWWSSFDTCAWWALEGNSMKRRLGYKLPNAENDRQEESSNRVQQLIDQPLKGDSQFVLLRATLFAGILPLIGFLLLPGFALRALVVSRFDPTVAIALVQFTQPVNFVLAFLLEALSVYIYAIGLLILFWAGRWYSSVTRNRLLLVMGAFLFNLVCSVPIILQSVFPEYPTYALILLLVPVTAFTTGRRWQFQVTKTNLNQLRRFRAKEELESYSTIVETRNNIWLYRSMLLFTTVIVAVSGHMWLAPEVLTIRGVPKTEYVLQQQDQDLIIFDRSLNTVLRVPKTDISYRQFCDRGPYFTVSEYVFGRPHGRPPCPGLS
jgi:hypothetical protein